MMNREEYRFKITREIFSFAEDKKILIYGTAKNAQFLINTLRDYIIVGAIDAYKVEGDVAGVPIITWDDVDVDTADILIIAARSEVQREIFHRIKHYAVLKDLKIYNLVGHEYTTDSYFSDYEAEEMAEGKDIYHIYDILKQRLNISDEQSKKLVKEEIRCEKNCTVARAKMVEAFNYAKNAGKKGFHNFQHVSTFPYYQGHS